MKPTSNWSYERYRPVVHSSDEIYICRIVPDSNSITLFWVGGKGCTYTVRIRKKELEDDWDVYTTYEQSMKLDHLEAAQEYEFDVSSGDMYSTVGYARTGNAPGIAVNYLHPQDPKYSFSGQHLCTPSLVKHPNGYLLASMDVYEARMPQNLTLIFRSDDNGETWYHYSELFPCFWGKLFVHAGEVYMLCTSAEYGDLLVGKSIDGGKTWMNPTVLFRGTCHWKMAGWHKSAMPIIEHCGRLWTGIDYGSWCTGGHASCLLSVGIEDDLLEADNWSLTEPLSYDPKWSGSVDGDSRGFLEGNAVVMPDGGIANLLRYATDKGTPNCCLIPILRGNCENPEKQLSFEKYVSFPGNLSKFDILYDAESRYYYSIISRIHDVEHPGLRNLLSLIKSPDLENWEIVTDLLDYRDQDPKITGLQYVSILFDGDDLLFLCRTAVNGAESFHDSNYITFHRVKKFRDISSEKTNCI